MTRTASADLKDHLAGTVTTVAYCWLLTRQDGEVFGFTDHDVDITLDGVTYAAATGFTATAVQTSAAFAVDNLDVDGVLSSDAITDDDLLAGRWDHAEIRVFLVNWANLAHGPLKMRRGWLGQVQTGRGVFTAELRGMMQTLQQQVGQLYGPTCRADLGDSRCGVSLAPLTFAATVTAVTSRRVFAAAALTQADSYFDYGRVTWTTGDNAGLVMEVKSSTQSGAGVELQLPMPFAVAIGDAFEIVAGCDRNFATCQSKFSNAVNYRGEPHLPGVDQILKAGRLGT